MPWLPDTNVWISILKQPQSLLEQRVRSASPEHVFFCSIVKAELWHGTQRYGNRERRMRALDALFAPFPSLPFDDAAARHYAKIRSYLENSGILIGPNDLKIAAIARANFLTVVTRNTNEFGRVPNLLVEDWEGGR